MAAPSRNATAVIGGSTPAVWAANDRVLALNEIGVEIDTATNVVRFKIGDGTSLYSALSYLDGSGSGGGDLLAANNLSDLASAPTARTNLGLGSAALLASSALLLGANNLSDIANAATARTNLGLGTAATQASTAFDSAGAAAAAQAASQPLDADLTAIAALSTTSLGRSVLTRARATFSDANYTITATDSIVAQTGTLTAPRTATLPAASAVPAGWEVIVADESGSVTSTNTITVARSGSDTIDGTASEVLQAAYGWRRFVSDGATKWSFDKGVLRAANNLSDVSSAATARTNLGLGNVEDTALSTWAGSTNVTTLGTISAGSIPYARLTGTPSLGTIASQDANNVAITGGTISGLTSLAVNANGAAVTIGTGTNSAVQLNFSAGRAAFGYDGNDSLINGTGGHGFKFYTNNSATPLIYGIGTGQRLLVNTAADDGSTTVQVNGSISGTVITASTAFRGVDGSNSVPTFALGVTNTGFYRDSDGGGIRFTTGGTLRGSFDGSALRHFSEAGAFTLGSLSDVVLTRDAANTLAQRNGTNGQVARWYRSFTDASNYERLRLDTTGTTMIFGTEAAGTGTVRALAIRSGNLGWQVSTAGSWVPESNNSFDFGTAALTVRTGYFGTSLGIGADPGTKGLDVVKSYTNVNGIGVRYNVTHSATTGTLPGVPIGEHIQVSFVSTGQLINQGYAQFLECYVRPTMATGGTQAAGTIAATRTRLNATGSNLTGTITTGIGFYADRPRSDATSVTSVTFTNIFGVQVGQQDSWVNGGGGVPTVGSACGVAINNNSAATANTNLLIGTVTIPAGTWSIYNSSSSVNYHAGRTLFGTTTDDGSTAVQVTGAVKSTTFFNAGSSFILAGSGDGQWAASGMNLKSSGIYGWSATTNGSGAADAALSRTGAAEVSIGNGTSGNTSGTLRAANLRFGTHAALAGETVTGYITITDAAGNTRKLAVVS